MLVCVAAAGCVVAPSVSLGVQHTRPPVERQAISLGTHVVNAVNGLPASANVADSVLRDLGWGIESVDGDPSGIMTSWLYLEGPLYDPTRVHRCGSASDVGLRLFLRPATRGDVFQYSIRAEMQPTGATSGDDERLAREGYYAVVAKLDSALARPLATADSGHARAGRVSAEGRVSKHAWGACAIVDRP